MAMTSWLVVIVTTMAVVWQGTSASMDTMAKDIEHTETIHIYHVTPEHIRQRRSTDGHPEELHFEFRHGEGQLQQVSKLRLRRAADDEGSGSKNMRVYRVRNDRLMEVPDSETEGGNGDGPQPQKDIGFFTDEDKTSLFRLRSSRNRLRAYDLDGTVIMNNREYIVSPNNEYLEVNGSARAHRLCRLMKHLDYGLDALDDGNRIRSRVNSRRPAPARRFPWYAKPYRSGRKRRQAETTIHYVEVVFYCDFSCYNKFETNSMNNRRSANDSIYGVIRNHFTFIAKAMNLRYASITNMIPDQQILISAQNLVVLDRADLSEFTEANQAGGIVDAKDTILSFRSYIRGGNGVPRADHWMLFTAYDLAAAGNRNTIGIAFLNRICSDSSVSIVEEFFSGTTAQIATHELGHILGAEHDSAYGQCTDNNYNIMAGIAFFPLEGEKIQNPWKFSSCSAQVITDFVSGATGACLKNRPSRIVTSPEEGGQTFNADTQCQLSQGPRSFFCRGVQKERGLDTMCVRMYCYLPDEAPNCIGLVALDGTSCGDGSWCKRGRCTRDPNAPRIPEGNICPQGDDPFYGCTQRSCNDTEARYTFCCKTCTGDVRPTKQPPNPRPLPNVPPIPIQARPPPVNSINQILPPAPPPLNPRAQRYPSRRHVIASRTTTTTTTTTTTAPIRRPVRRPSVVAPWWRIPAPPPPPPPPSPSRFDNGNQQRPAGRGGIPPWECNTEICRCLTRSNSFATCLYRSWFTGR